MLPCQEHWKDLLTATGLGCGPGRKDNYNFVKRIPTWDVPASRNPEQISDVTASPVTQMIYVAARGRLGA